MNTDELTLVNGNGKAFKIGLPKLFIIGYMNETVFMSLQPIIDQTNNETRAAIRQIVDVPTSQRSNFPNRDPYVVQAWSNVDGWQDTKESACTPATAHARAQMLLDRDSSWMGDHRMVRVVPCLSLK